MNKSTSNFFLFLCILKQIWAVTEPQTVLQTIQYHSLPQNYYLEQRLTSNIFYSNNNNMESRVLLGEPIQGNFNITIENTDNNSYIFNILTFPSKAPQAVTAYKCYVRGATEGFKVHNCPFTNITLVNGSCTECFQRAVNNLNQSSACLGCNYQSYFMNIVLYQQSNQSVGNSEQNNQNSDILLIIDNTNVISPTGGVYLEMQIGYSINLTKQEDGINMIFLWIIIIVVFIFITGGLIAYLCFKIRQIEKQKVKLSDKQS